MLHELRTLNLSHVETDEAIALWTFGRQLQNSYVDLKIDVPDWIDNKVTELRRELDRRRVDAIHHKLARAHARAEALKTDSERRKDVKKEIETLEEQLAEASA